MGKSSKNRPSVTIVGLDIAKSVFQAHGVDAKGAAIVARSVRRGGPLKFFASPPPCLVGIEACSSAHHWHTVTGAHFPFISPGLARWVGRGGRQAWNWPCRTDGAQSNRDFAFLKNEKHARLIHIAPRHIRLAGGAGGAFAGGAAQKFGARRKFRNSQAG